MDELSAELIRSRLAARPGRRLGRDVRYFERIGSTNDALVAEAGAGAAEGLVAVAGEQTAGRGRQGRSWWAPAGSSLLMSLLLRPAVAPEQVTQTTMCLGLGAADGIADITGLQVGLKWPNDLVHAGRKLAGMLTEMDLAADRLNWVVLGLGINVNFRLRGAGAAIETAAGAAEVPLVEAPEDVAATATTLAMALGRPVSRLDLLAAILAATERWYEGLLAGRAPTEAWAERLVTLGQDVQVTLPGGEVLTGLAQAVTPEGALVLAARGGRRHTIWAGDVTMLRHTGLSS